MMMMRNRWQLARFNPGRFIVQGSTLSPQCCNRKKIQRVDHEGLQCGRNGTMSQMTCCKSLNGFWNLNKGSIHLLHDYCRNKWRMGACRSHLNDVHQNAHLKWEKHALRNSMPTKCGSSTLILWWLFENFESADLCVHVPIVRSPLDAVTKNAEWGYVRLPGKNNFHLCLWTYTCDVQCIRPISTKSENLRHV